MIYLNATQKVQPVYNTFSTIASKHPLNVFVWTKIYWVKTREPNLQKEVLAFYDMVVVVVVFVVVVVVVVVVVWIYYNNINMCLKALKNILTSCFKTFKLSCWA